MGRSGRQGGMGPSEPALARTVQCRPREPHPNGEPRRRGERGACGARRDSPTTVAGRKIENAERAYGGEGRATNSTRILQSRSGMGMKNTA